MKDLIGVFDSGIGGLTVLKQLAIAYPNQDFIYLADAKNNPYGTKSKEELQDIINENINYLINRDVKAIIIACNTASSLDIKNYNIPIYKIIEPTALIANIVSKKVGILATNYTINTRAYEKFLEIESVGLGCSEFVSLIEEDKFNTEEGISIIENKIEFLRDKVDSIILGCTHFHLLTNIIKSYFPDLQIVDSSLSMIEIIKDIVTKTSKIGSIEIVNTSKKSLYIDWFNLDYKLTYI